MFRVKKALNHNTIIAILNPADRKGNVIRHREQDAPVNAPEGPLTLFQHLFGNLQKDRIHILDQIYSVAALGD